MSVGMNEHTAVEQPLCGEQTQLCGVYDRRIRMYGVECLIPAGTAILRWIFIKEVQFFDGRVSSDGVFHQINGLAGLDLDRAYI